LIHVVPLWLVLDERWLQELLAGGIKVSSAGFRFQINMSVWLSL
jgi:hypothetical protein